MNESRSEAAKERQRIAAREYRARKAIAAGRNPGKVVFKNDDERKAARRETFRRYREKHIETIRTRDAETKRNERMEAAIAAGREPGRTGNPRKRKVLRYTPKAMRQTPEEIEAYNALLAKNRIVAKERKAARAIAEGREPGKVGGPVIYKTEEERKAASLAKCRRWRERHLTDARQKDAIARRKRRARKHGTEGSHSKEDIKLLWKLQRGKCAFCLEPLDKDNFHVDHYMPIIRNGPNDRGNLRLLHPKCNQEKSSKDPYDHAKQNGLLCW